MPLDRHIGGLSAIEDSPDIDTGLPMDSGNVGSVADQSADQGEFACGIDCGNGVACGQLYKLPAPAMEERISCAPRPGVMPSAPREGSASDRRDAAARRRSTRDRR